MKPNDQTGASADLNNLEMLGLLASRIIHDLKNKLAVISGHAQFAEIAKQNPKAMADAMAIIKRVSEEAGKHVEALAKLRKALPTERGECELAEVQTLLERLLQAKPGWRMAPPQNLAGARVAIQPRWLKYVLEGFLLCCRAATGEVRLDQAYGYVPLGGADVAPPNPEHPCLRVRISCQNCNSPAATEDPAAQFRSLAVSELLRRVEGGLIQQASPDGREEITILIPLVVPTTERR